MRFLALLIALVALLRPTVCSQATAASMLGLSSEQLPTDCRTIDGYFPVDMQTAILWDKPDLYKGVIPLPIARNAQSFACRADKGTVYSFQFADEAKRKIAAAFIKPLLWGESGPTADHPELVLEAGDVLRVVSFRKTPKVLLAALQGSAKPSSVR